MHHDDRYQPWTTARCHRCGRSFDRLSWTSRVTDINGNTSHDTCVRAMELYAARRWARLQQAETNMQE